MGDIYLTLKFIDFSKFDFSLRFLNKFIFETFIKTS